MQMGLAALAFLIFAGYLAFALTIGGWMGAPHPHPLALDFDAFWSAARIALQEGARASYDNTVIEAFERANTTVTQPGYLAFYYPPSFLLLCLPLALLPYTMALLAFEAAQATLLWPALKRILGGGWAWLPVLACPGFAMNVFSGQNGGLSAACLGYATLTLERAPWIGGACLGLLSCKPQLAACVPVALLAARRWRAAASAAITAAVLAGAATIVLGSGAWAGFLANAPAARRDIETLAIKWPMMQSVYGGFRLAGSGVQPAYAAQILVTAAALGVLVWVCWRRVGARAEMAALAVAALLVTPFLYDYDLILMVVPVAWLAGEASRQDWRLGEKPILLLCYLAPLAARAVGLILHVPIGPPLALALLALIARRTARA